MDDFNPYDVLGVARDAGDKQIKAAYRRLSALLHPDKPTGDINKFLEMQNAYEILSDPGRRQRYDATGRTDDSKVTPARVQEFLKSMINSVVEARRPDGSSDNPIYDNILGRILLSIKNSRAEITANRIETQRKLGRALRLKERFIPKTDADPVGEVLQAEIDRLKTEMRQHEDAMELSAEAERVFRTYHYRTGEVPGQAEGQSTRPETVRLPRTFGGVDD